MTDHRPARAAARYGAVVALAGALVAPGAALTAPTAFADSKLPIGVASDPAATPSATPSAEQSKTADPTQSASPNPTSASPKSTDSKPANPVKATVTISTEKWREGKLVMRGEGFVSNASGRGAVFAVKFLDALPDNAHEAINPLTNKGGNSPANFMAIANEDGTFEVEVPLPTAENTGLSAEDLAKAGWAVENTEHNVQILSGSLGGADMNGNNYDRGVSIRQKIKLSDTAPEYKPTEAPEAIHATALTDGKGVQVRRDGSTVTVTVPDAEPGTWVYAATYLGDSPQALYASGWKRLDDNHSFSYETSGSMPSATYRVVVHNGNQGAENAVLGFADMTVERAAAPREDVSDDDLSSYEAEPALATIVTPAETVVNRVQAKAKEEAEAEKQAAKEAAAAEKQAAKEAAAAEKQAAKEAAAAAKQAEKEAAAAAREEKKKAAQQKRIFASIGGSVTGTIGREVGKQLGKSAGGSFGKQLGGNVGASLGRGILKTLLKF